MNWINISEIDTHEEIEGKNILVWLKNLADSECSRFQRAVFLKGNERICSFIKLYPITVGNSYYKQDEDYTNYDLEGDMCKITHFAIVDAPID